MASNDASGNSYAIVGFMGRAGAGKDTAADHLVRAHGYTKCAFADPLKEACRAMFGFTDEQLYGHLKEVKDQELGFTPRHAMQWFGTDLVRKHMHELMPDVGENFWAHLVMVKHQKGLMKDPNHKTVVSDVRFPNEVDIINEMGGIVIKLQRNAADEHGKNSKMGTHASEANVDKMTGYAATIENNDTAYALYTRVEQVVFNKSKMRKVD